MFQHDDYLAYGFIYNRKTLDGKADFYQGRVTCPTSGATAFIFVSLALLSLLRDSEEVHCDATFEVVPNQFYQLFTLHITAYGKVSASIANIFKKSKIVSFQHNSGE